MPWSEAWLAAIAQSERDLWRGVEAQHRVATMRLVDDLREQELLEQLLDGSKPPLPSGAAGAHYLLSTPFRYVSPWPSRFRRPGEPGAWYGADEPATVAAELAYWRWRFFMDSDAFQGEQVVTEHTFFQARFSGSELDLTAGALSEHRMAWRDPQDYGACHELASRLRGLTPPVQAIRYESARRERGLCQVVFDVQALAIHQPHVQQTWICKTTAARVLMAHDSESLQFDM
jgi:hypothetical protein